jgi:hypothetical protein
MFFGSVRRFSDGAGVNVDCFGRGHLRLEDVMVAIIAYVVFCALVFFVIFNDED